MKKMMCTECLTVFKYPAYRTNAKFCSIKCRAKNASQNLTGDKRYNYKGNSIHTEGYILIKVPGHPYAHKQTKYVPEHRLIMEKKLGKFIDPKIYHIHHIDGNKKNNSENNLTVVTPEEHRRLEEGWKKVGNSWWKTCRGCKIYLKVCSLNFYKRSTGRLLPRCKQCTIQEVKCKKRKGISATFVGKPSLRPNHAMSRRVLSPTSNASSLHATMNCGRCSPRASLQ